MTIHEIAEEASLPLDAVKRAITSTRYLHPEKFFRVVAYRPVTGRYAKDLRVYAAEPGADAPQRTKPAQREKARQARYRDKHRALINARARARKAKEKATNPWLGLANPGTRARMSVVANACQPA